MPPSATSRRGRSRSDPASGQRWDEAEAHYRETLRLADEIPDRIEQPEVRRYYAQLLAERDAPRDLDVARTLLTEAIDGYLRLGMPRHADIAAAGRHSLP
jgi:DNA transposition AAA+ family ATPase